MSRRLLSAGAGRFAQTRASRRLIPWFAAHYGVNLQEALEPAGGFATLQQFFTRRLRPGARPLAAAADLVAPCDGTCGACGSVADDTLVQAKGHTYSLSALLGAGEAAAPFRGGLYATIYLAPGDYHRVHAPADANFVAARHLPGAYHSVNPRAVAKIPALFARNERMILDFDTPRGRFALVLVGACLVGGIRLVAPPPRAVPRGEEVAWFEFGSTVIVLASSGVASALSAAPNQRVRMGEPLASAV